MKKCKIYCYNARYTYNGDITGRFEIYNAEGDCVAASGKRRIKGFAPEHNTVCGKKIEDNLGTHKYMLNVLERGMDSVVYEAFCEENN